MGHVMGFVEAVQTVITKRFADFQGRSQRAEYWWFFLFNILLQFVLMAIVAIMPTIGGILALLVILALIIPGIAVTIRRFHDLDKSGWWILISFVPFLGVILLIYWFTQKGTSGENRFGADPLAGA